MTSFLSESLDSTSVGCVLIERAVQSNPFGHKGVAAKAGLSPDTVRTWADHRRRPGFDAMFELMVYDEKLFQDFIEERNSRVSECQKK